MVIQSDPVLVQAYPTAAGGEPDVRQVGMGGPGSRVQRAPPSVVVTSSPLPSAQP